MTLRNSFLTLTLLISAASMLLAQTTAVEQAIIQATMSGNTTLLHSPEYHRLFSGTDEDISLAYLYNNYVLEEEFCEAYETTNNTWNSDKLTQFSYTQSGKIDTIYKENWWNNTWNAYNRSVFFYDPGNGRLLESVFESTLVTGSWQNVSRQQHSYNQVGLDTIIVRQVWGNLGWENQSRTIYSYDQLNRFEKLTFDVWNDFSNSWDLSSQTLYTFVGSTTNISDFVVQSWDNGVWDNLGKTSYFYNSQNQFEEILNQIWVSGNWFNSTHFLYFYDNNNDLSEVQYQQWDNVSTWNDFIRTVYTIDGNGNQATWQEDFWVSNAWIPNRRCTNTWQLVVTSIEEPGSTLPFNFALQNYPNPFNPATTIRFTLPTTQKTRLTVYNTLGQEVAVLLDAVKQAGTHEVPFQAQQLSSGTYFYKLQAAQATLTGTMLLIK
ncbi:MAG: T9SS type A sorting domain-containing protein [Calditrichia bacterium]